MQEDKNTEKLELCEEALEEVTGGTEWFRDPDETASVADKDGFREKPGTGQAPDGPSVSANGVMDRIAIGFDRIRENITKAALKD